MLTCHYAIQICHYGIQICHYAIQICHYAIMPLCHYVIMQLCYFAHFGSPGCPTLLTGLKQKGKRPGFYFLYLITLMSAFSSWTPFRALFTIESPAVCSDNMLQSLIIQIVKARRIEDREDWQEESTFSSFRFGLPPPLPPPF